MSDAMAQLYQQVILDHDREHHGFGLTPTWDGESFQVNPSCGDQIRLRVQLDEGAAEPTLKSVTWEGTGCSISQASASILTDLMVGASVKRADELIELFRALMDNRGKDLPEAEQEQLGDAAAFTGVAKFPSRIKCALLGWMALRDALAHAVTGC